MTVWKSAKYILANRELYDEANIQIDTDWLNGQHDENLRTPGTLLTTQFHLVPQSQVKITILILTRTMIHMMN